MLSLRQRIRSSTPSRLITWVLVWIFALHAASLYLFTRGFLLSRLALSDKATCTSSKSCSLPPTHSKAILIIIDSLRFDFIAPTSFHQPDQNHHGVLTLPAELAAQSPDRSFIFNAHSDPPTATLQRIKGITTGSLPTFVDIGSSFGASEISEDSLIHQLTAAGKRVAFMGDDTWTGVYPTSFHPNMTWPYDSFNVEDLHTVDEGVIRHIFPLVRDGGWDFAIGHFLGVDHAGHRVGPSGDTMRAKLKQMDSVLRKLTEEIDDDTLLVVLGDHGMDLKGDHGGDGILETSSAMWIYSKSVPLATRPLPQDALSSPDASAADPDAEPSDVAWKTFPGATSPNRAVQQIDIVPTISLLLGLPIPFNNLGMVIPELFLRDSASNGVLLDQAMQLNVDQIQAYLAAYRASPSGGELDEAWGQLNRLHGLATNPTASLRQKRNFIRQTLRSCRELWAQFNLVLMVAGLVALGLTIPVVWSVYRAIDQGQSSSWEAISGEALRLGTMGAAVGGASGLVIKIVGRPFMGPFSLLQAILLGAVFGSEWNVLRSLSTVTLFTFPRKFFHRHTALPVLVLILHAISYTSNSFLMWEDRLTQYFLFTLLFTSVVISAPTAPTHRLRIRIFGFSLATAVLVRLISISTVCREEQQPYCSVTFYSSSTTPVAPYLTMFGAPIATFALPYIMERFFLATSRADEAPMTRLFHRICRWLLLGASTYWILERLENWNGLNPDRIPLVQTVRTYIARGVLGGIIAVLGAFWWYSPLSILVRDQTPQEGEQGGKKRVVVIGFANAYGSSYLLFLLIPFALVFATAQPTGQVVLGLGLVAISAYVEVVDGESDADGMVEAFTSTSVTSSATQLQTAYQKPTFAVPAFLSILSMLLFYSTGHQATLPSIQWRSAFIGFPTLTYPFAPILVILNTFGPIAVATLAAPLFALWNIDPPKPNAPTGQAESTPSSSPSSLVLNRTLKLTLGTSLYHSALTFGTAFGAAALRRHLMVWKVFAPRYMLGGASLLVVDLALVFGVGVGVSRVVWKVEKTFGAGRAKQQ